MAPWACWTPSAPQEKALHANMGGHAGVPQFEGTPPTGASPST
ncbi:hypothetical protein [Blastococcus brunescens]|uniref:Uncharacterized protein n=1 Tax=Blastococcus brunescens TaxID=1564165 RepID=A0ABZ1ATN1_9ACTN|nr:hypothetical protein [Blastococcus sp. BMG 8361]WRL61799.1 hypothetical protein U6N30_16865 [Blastococcus sp. BMG 8361]